MPKTILRLVDDWADVMMEALCASDGGNNPFYSDDEDTISLARQLAEAVVERLANPPLLPEDPSDIAVVPDARREMWLTAEQKRQPR